MPILRKSDFNQNAIENGMWDSLVELADVEDNGVDTEVVVIDARPTVDRMVAPSFQTAP